MRFLLCAFAISLTVGMMGHAEAQAVRANSETGLDALPFALGGEVVLANKKLNFKKKFSTANKKAPGQGKPVAKFKPKTIMGHRHQSAQMAKRINTAKLPSSKQIEALGPKLSVNRLAVRRLTERTVKPAAKALAKRKLTSASKTSAIAKLRGPKNSLKSSFSKPQIRNLSLRKPVQYATVKETPIQHSLRWHGHGNAVKGDSQFSKKMTATRLEKLTRTALRKGTIKQRKDGSYVVTHKFSRPFDTNKKGKPVKTLNVIIRDGAVRTIVPGKK
ncbi:MAG: hypothetical protein AAFZ46_19500 [Pseudomonadota bacterium]